MQACSRKTTRKISRKESKKYLSNRLLIIPLFSKELLQQYVVMISTEVLHMSVVLYVPHALHYCPTGGVSYFEYMSMVFIQFCIQGFKPAPSKWPAFMGSPPPFRVQAADEVGRCSICIVGWGTVSNNSAFKQKISEASAASVLWYGVQCPIIQTWRGDQRLHQDSAGSTVEVLCTHVTYHAAVLMNLFQSSCYISASMDFDNVLLSGLLYEFPLQHSNGRWRRLTQHLYCGMVYRSNNSVVIYSSVRPKRLSMQHFQSCLLIFFVLKEFDIIEDISVPGGGDSSLGCSGSSTLPSSLSSSSQPPPRAVGSSYHMCHQVNKNIFNRQKIKINI